ncbi:MAG TPA: hypothetical protein VEJ46_04825 [Candidatus Acidoferrum sp.]|nr:hypothetical protein [Candidatus Acidoferrum sp.]
MPTQPKREVKCQICRWSGHRYYGAKGILVDPCPQCGSRVTYAAPQKGDMPATADPKLLAEAA